MPEEYLVAKDLHKSFNEHKAVNGVSFTIHKREIFGLLGPNGAGKTTTIRMLSTVLEPDQGDVTIGGHSTKREADEVRNLIGVCPQELALYVELGALDNLVFFGRMAGLSSQEAREQAMANLSLVGLEEKASASPASLSWGEQKLLGMARALAAGPELLLLDEPYGGLMTGEIEKLSLLLLDVQHQGVTILMVEHLTDVVMGIANQIIVLHYGEKIAEGTPAEIQGNEQVIATYLGTEPGQGASG